VVSTRQFTKPLFPPPPCPVSFGGVGMNVCSAIEPRSVITGVSYRNRASFGRFLSPSTPYGPHNYTKSSGWGIFPTQHPAPHPSRSPGFWGYDSGSGTAGLGFPARGLYGRAFALTLVAVRPASAIGSLVDNDPIPWLWKTDPGFGEGW
jgi:hypothetical protein